MAQRGRKSKASLMVIEGGPVMTRPDPPDSLTKEQAELWRKVVNDEPLNLFATAALQEMLVDLVRHRTTADDLTKTINKMAGKPQTADSIKFFTQLLKARDVEVQAATRIATKLRMTNQSRVSAVIAGTTAAETVKGGKPWDWKK